MKIKVSVPATSANIGSGFDALGLAVTLYNTVTFEDSEVLDISSADGTRIPRGESNLVYRSAKGLFEKVGKQIPPLKITQTNPIPMARGCSAVCSSTATQRSSRAGRCMRWPSRTKSPAMRSSSPDMWRFIWAKGGISTPPVPPPAAVWSSTALSRMTRCIGRIW